MEQPSLTRPIIPAGVGRLRGRVNLWALGQTGLLPVAAPLADRAPDLTASFGALAVLIHAARRDGQREIARLDIPRRRPCRFGFGDFHRDLRRPDVLMG